MDLNQSGNAFLQCADRFYSMNCTNNTWNGTEASSMTSLGSGWKVKRVIPLLTIGGVSSYVCEKCNVL